MLRLLYLSLFLGYSLCVNAQCESYEFNDIFEASWLSCDTSAHPALDTSRHWIQYDLGQVKHLGGSHIWNFNLNDIQNGAKEIGFYISLDSSTWTFVGTDTLDIASGEVGYLGQSSIDFEGKSARYILIAALNNYGGSCTGLSEVKIDFDEQQCPSIELLLEFDRKVCSQSVETNVRVTPVGNTGPYSLFWSNGATSDTVNDIATGSHDIIVVDSDNCARSFSFSIDSISTDINEFAYGIVKTGIYIADSVGSGGRILPESQVDFLFSEQTVLNEDFTVLLGAELIINFVDCANNPTTSLTLIRQSSPTVSQDSILDFFGLGNGSYLQVTSSSEDNSNYQQNTINGLGSYNDEAAARFLSQATLGYDLDMVEQVSDLSPEQWIDWQLSIESESYFNHLQNIMRFDQPNINYWLNFHRTWWHNTLTGDEYLRERVAFALSQIFVISSKSFLLNYGDGLTSYYDMLLNHSFGNFRDLLYDVTMHPTMGFYLSHLNNPKTDASINQFPDENYAREVLQLFSIGLYELNLDGTRKKDAQGNDIPTYTNDDIIQFAKVFTGLGFSGLPFGSTSNISVIRPYTFPMQMNEEEHEHGVKNLLNGQTIPVGQTGLEDINDALDNIYNHPNVGPFISTRLIQRLVKSEPSPEYVERVATLFNDNGRGVRGDLKAVLKGILLDPEARDCSWIDNPTTGMLKEPILRILQLIKAFRIENTTNTFYAIGENIEQFTHQGPLRAPSVFNFYQSDHKAPGDLSDQNIRSPEFNILDSYSSIGYINIVDSLSLNVVPLDIEEGQASLNFQEELAVASDSEALINLLDSKLTYGNLSDRTRQIIENALSLIGSDPVERVRIAFYIIANSSDFTILR